MSGAILIVEDLAEARDWLAGVVAEAFPKIQILAAPSVAAAFAALDEMQFDMALVDLGLPDGSGLDVIRKIRQQFPETTCIVSTVLGDDAHLVSALSAGAEGYVLKGQPAPLLKRQLLQIKQGIPALSPAIARRIMEHFKRTGPVAEVSEVLTPRENEVLALIAKGLRNADAAVALGMSEATVATHIKSIYRKLGISSRAEAALHATRLGLT
ncbi:DNA-binding response regulator [Devosia pacifica]|uniref:DNA-binding response regulator n=1 Tax=Devosia pacifica TaxID=1335967 RepID=A0A918RUC8_9HYPH|nr:response regulator transcription factor [Devosia pacifica]GHA12358.1 DNA-binding response regulator [Devosia pacifica]